MSWTRVATLAILVGGAVALLLAGTDKVTPAGYTLIGLAGGMLIPSRLSNNGMVKP